jgi:hypothetical protein
MENISTELRHKFQTILRLKIDNEEGKTDEQIRRESLDLYIIPYTEPNKTLELNQ